MAQFRDPMDELRMNMPLTPENVAKYGSKRFGALAYIAPVGAWPRLPELSRWNRDIRVNQRSPGVYDVYYTRTNRYLGTYSGYGGGDRIHPQTADYILDVADELNRIDPNVYRYDLRPITRLAQAAFQARQQQSTSVPSGIPDQPMILSQPYAYNQPQTAALLQAIRNRLQPNQPPIMTMAGAKKEAWR